MNLLLILLVNCYTHTHTHTRYAVWKYIVFNIAFNFEKLQLKKCYELSELMVGRISEIMYQNMSSTFDEIIVMKMFIELEKLFWRVFFIMKTHLMAIFDTRQHKTTTTGFSITYFWSNLLMKHILSIRIRLMKNIFHQNVMT